MIVKNEKDANWVIFTRRLARSQDAVEFVADYLRDQGFNVRVNTLKIAPDPTQANEYRDHGDLEVYSKMEVKGLVKTCFSSREDFPYADIIVCNKKSYDDADPKPLRYYIVSADKRGMAVISVPNTKDKWYVKRIADQDYGGKEEDKYMVSARWAQWLRFDPIKEEV